MRDYDLVVIGAGPGGYEAALEAAGVYGMKTALVERESIGGTCLNHGCIPTKTLLHSAELYEQMKECESLGLSAENVVFDMGRIQDRKTQVLDQLRNGIAAMLKQKKVEVLSGTGCIRDAHTVSVKMEDGTERTLDTVCILIATGSKAFLPPIPGADLPNVVTSDELLDKRDGLYQRLLIIGGGVIGMEFASFYRALGAEVTVVEALPRIIANLDRELSQSLKMLLKKRGVEIVTDARVEKIEAAEDGSLCCTYAEKDVSHETFADGILICTGRRPFTEGLFAEGFTLPMERGRITAGEDGETAEPGVYAIGDVTGGAMLAHTATAMGRNAVRHMYTTWKQEMALPYQNKKKETVVPECICLSVVPSCIYTSPEIASTGLTLDQAKEQGMDADSRKIVITSNGKTIIAGLDRSFMKGVFEKESHRILGAQMMCGRASDLIAEFTEAVVNGHTLEDLSRVIRPHPTFSEAVTDACR